MPARIEYKKGDKLGPYNIEFIEDVEPDISPCGKKSRKGKFICPECGTFFETRIEGIKNGHTKSCGCIRKKIRIENGKKRAKDLTGKRFGKLIALKKTEKRNGHNIIWKCKCDCGKITYVSTNHLSDGHTKSCGCNTESRGEEKIRFFLQSLNINFETQKTFNKCKNPKTDALFRFDFYLFDYNCCIEYDGILHFKESSLCRDTLEERQYRDNIKNQYCKDNNIKLIRIPYTEFDNIEEILTKELNL